MRKPRSTKNGKKRFDIQVDNVRGLSPTKTIHLSSRPPFIIESKETIMTREDTLLFILNNKSAEFLSKETFLLLSQ